MTQKASVLERTRELGMLRAVGMARGTVRAMVRWESAMISLLGVVQGIVVGLGLGYAVVVALRNEGLKSFSIPTAALVSYLIVGLLCGILAGAAPAWRASRVNIVEAVQSD